MPRRANTHNPSHALNMAIAGIEDATSAITEATDFAELGNVPEAYSKLQDAKRYLAASSAHVHYASDAPDFRELRNDIFRNYEELNEAISLLERSTIYPCFGGQPRLANRRRSQQEDVGSARTRQANNIALKNKLI